MSSVIGQLIEKKKLEKEGFEFGVYQYKANAHFSDGSCLRGVFVLEEYCYSVSPNGLVLIFRPQDQKKGFRLERIYEN